MPPARRGSWANTPAPPARGAPPPVVWRPNANLDAHLEHAVGQPARDRCPAAGGLPVGCEQSHAVSGCFEHILSRGADLVQDRTVDGEQLPSISSIAAPS